jgi:HK97 gp10 family phage protein
MARRLKSITKKSALRAAGGFEGIEQLDAALKEIGQSLAGIDTAIVAVDRKIAPHAHWVEYGTIYTGSRPFFRPAIMNKKTEVSKYIGTEIGKVIEGTRADGKNIMIEGAQTFKNLMVSLAPMGKHKPHRVSKTSKVFISPGDLQRGIVTRQYGRTTKSGIFFKD